MFDKNSRYATQPTYFTTTADGRTAVAVAIPAPRTEIPVGQHRRAEGDRADLLAARYLNEPTCFWRLCDLNGTTIVAALEARPLIAIPRGGRR